MSEEGQRWEKIIAQGKIVSEGGTQNVSGVAVANWVSYSDWTTCVCVSFLKMNFESNLKN